MRKQFFEDDSVLDAGIRTSNPFPVEQTPELDKRALDDLASILAGPPVEYASADMSTEPAAASVAEAAPNNVVTLDSKRKTTRRWVLGALAAVAAGVLVAVPIGTSLNGPAMAVAAPAPLTTIVPTALGTEAAIEKLVEAASATVDPADFQPGHLDVEHWEGGNVFFPLAEQHAEPISAEGDIGELLTLTEVAVDDRVSIPTTNEIRREPDGSGSIRQTVGEPYSSTGQPVEIVPFEGNLVPGSIETLDFATGTMKSMFPEGPAVSSGKLFNQLQDHQLSNSAAVGDGSQGFIQTLGFMMGDWKFSQAQSIALARMLPRIDGLKMLGTAKDRWNRDTLVFGVDTAGHGGTYRTMLMFSPATGRVLDYQEEFRVEKNSKDKPDFEFDTVVRYIAVSE